MTQPLEALGKRFSFNSRLLALATEGFEDQHWSFRPETGGNSALWILGHVASARRGMLRMIGETVEEDEWEKGFRRGAQPEDASYLPAADFVREFHSTGEALAAGLAALSEEVANSPSPREFPDGSKTIGDALHFLYFHETYHLGQIGLLRRLAGLDGFI
ncbi:MAG: DinB family protein [Planctomycetota bacterium]